MDTRALTITIREKLPTGTLPREKCRITWFGPGTGQTCVACDRRIVAPEVECECEIADDESIFLHRAASRCGIGSGRTSPGSRRRVEFSSVLT
ncbi:MAG TPA: hypothetical protein VGU22_01115 [Methylomirabilota bacterium]|jgi:hypothetical protein|nr:hypothetical protein [Methylomirabilota bacterium]